MSQNKEILNILANCKFEWLNSIIGAIILSICVGLYWNFRDKVVGMSGIMGRVIKLERLDTIKMDISFLIGMFLVGTYFCFYNTSLAFSKLLPFSIIQYVVGGYLIGLGTQLANGCTSGHGLCGIGRLAFRSIIATLTFLVTVIIVVNIEMYILNNSDFKFNILDVDNDHSKLRNMIIPIITMVIILIITYYTDLMMNTQYLFAFSIGSFFAIGLGIGGMLKQEKIISAFNLRNIDLSLWTLFSIGVLFSLIQIQTAILLKFRQNNKPTINKNVDSALIIGSILFGIGWGLIGMCPGPLMTLIPRIFFDNDFENKKILLVITVAFVCGVYTDLGIKKWKENVEKQRDYLLVDQNQKNI